MEKDYLILKRASASRPSGEWSDPMRLNVLGPFSHGAFVWAVTMYQYLFGGPTVLPQLSGIPQA
jgi:hypothetical protein